MACIQLNLLEQGTDLRYIQALLGHSSSKTAEIYSYVTHHGLKKIISRLERLNMLFSKYIGEPIAKKTIP